MNQLDLRYDLVNYRYSKIKSSHLRTYLSLIHIFEHYFDSIIDNILEMKDRDIKRWVKNTISKNINAIKECSLRIYKECSGSGNGGKLDIVKMLNELQLNLHNFEIPKKGDDKSIGRTINEDLAFEMGLDRLCLDDDVDFNEIERYAEFIDNLSEVSIINQRTNVMEFDDLEIN